MDIAKRTLLLTAISIYIALVFFSCEGKGKKADSSDAQAKIDTEQSAPSEPVKAGAYTDPRDGKTYKTLKIGGQTWMAENLNFKADSSLCYGDNESNCKKYGRLYDWNAAVKVCPSGWHLPSREEWQSLSLAARDGWGSSEALKSKTGWAQDTLAYRHDWRSSETLKSKTGREDNDGKSGNGTDMLGFSAFPGGYRLSDGSFESIGYKGRWWSATKDSSDKRDLAHNWGMNHDYGGSIGNIDDRSNRLSVRCIQDDAAYKASAPPPAPAIPTLPPPEIGKFDAPNPFNTDVFFQFMAYVEDKGTPWAEFKYTEVFTASSTREPYSAHRLKNDKNSAGGYKYGAWCEGAEGHGIGERVNMRIGATATSKDKEAGIHFKSLMLVNGVHGSETTWKDNSRVKALRLYVGGKPWCDLQLKDIEEPQIYHLPDNLKIYPAKSGHRESGYDTYQLELSFEILDVYPGESLDNTCITGIALDAGLDGM
ncbi:MAG: fibrobacter succinogenes major paralogous domain-containing protein [Chitinispirillales bacterium]|jgi:uncharacterized protein (TIGR02145 family)|nr:fibrobacter succinogenes major paralogous domain-containing protein [Chitinispirillales bacterium]